MHVESTIEQRRKAADDGIESLASTQAANGKQGSASSPSPSPERRSAKGRPGLKRLDVDARVDELDAPSLDAHSNQGLLREFAVGDHAISVAQRESHRTVLVALPPTGELLAVRRSPPDARSGARRARPRAPRAARDRHG